MICILSYRSVFVVIGRLNQSSLRYLNFNMPCGICNSNVSPSKLITCTICGVGFHSTCTKIGSSTNLKSLIGKWKCKNCSEANLTVRKKITSDENNSVDNFSLNSLADIKDGITSILSKIKSLTTTVDSVEASVTFCSNKIDDFDGKLDSLNLKMITFDNRLTDLDEKYNKLQTEIDRLKTENNILEQNRLINNIEVTGIPYTTNESLIDILINLSNKLNITLNVSDVSNIYRTKVSKENTSKIVVQFLNNSIKQELLHGIKKMFKNGNPLTAHNIHKSFQSTNVYINDHLSVGNRKLFWLSKLVAKQYEFKYVWANASGVFMKKVDGSTGYRVSSVDQLKKIDSNRLISSLYNI